MSTTGAAFPRLGHFKLSSEFPKCDSAPAASTATASGDSDAPRCCEHRQNPSMADGRGSKPPSAPSFLVLAGAAQGTVIPAPAGQYDFGREAALQGDLGGDPRLFRHQGRITDEGNGRMFIGDRGSANGTVLSGQRIPERQPMRNGDVVQLGSITRRLTSAVEHRRSSSTSHFDAYPLRRRVHIGCGDMGRERMGHEQRSAGQVAGALVRT